MTRLNTQKSRASDGLFEDMQGLRGVLVIQGYRGDRGRTLENQAILSPNIKQAPPPGILLDPYFILGGGVHFRGNRLQGSTPSFPASHQYTRSD